MLWFVSALALAVVAAESIPDVDTTYEIVTPWDGKGSRVSKEASVTVHATGLVEETGKSQLAHSST